MSRSSLDLLVIGGGPSGAVAARTARSAGLRTMLVEQAAGPRWKIGETLAPQSKPLLQSLGLLDRFLQSGHLSCPGNCSCWGTDELVEKDFIFSPIGSAWQLDREKFEAMLLEAAQEAGAEVRFNAPLQQLQFTGDRWETEVGGEKLQPRRLIDATGRRSFLARHSGVGRIKRDSLVSIYTTVSSPTGLDQDSRTYIEASPDGWWYTALMPSGLRTISFQTDSDLIQGANWRKISWLEERLGKTLHLSRLLHDTAYQFRNGLALTSAHSGRLKQFCGPGWFAVGDAAQSYDPLSGQGLFFAILSGQRVGQAVVASIEKPSTALEDHSSWMESNWARFVEHHQTYYKMESRWPISPFWMRRQTSAST